MNLNMTNWAQIEKSVIFQARVSIFGDLLLVWDVATNANFQLSIYNSEPARPITWDMGEKLLNNNMKIVKAEIL